MFDWNKIHLQCWEFQGEMRSDPTACNSSTFFQRIKCQSKGTMVLTLGPTRPSSPGSPVVPGGP